MSGVNDMSCATLWPAQSKSRILSGCLPEIFSSNSGVTSSILTRRAVKLGHHDNTPSKESAFNDPIGCAIVSFSSWGPTHCRNSSRAVGDTCEQCWILIVLRVSGNVCRFSCRKSSLIPVYRQRIPSSYTSSENAKGTCVHPYIITALRVWCIIEHRSLTSSKVKRLKPRWPKHIIISPFIAIRRSRKI